MNTLLFAGYFIAVFAEALFIFGLVLATFAYLVRTKKIAPAWLVLWAPISMVAVIASQEPWDDDGGQIVVASRPINGARVAVTRYNGGLCECNTQFWYQDSAGKWSGYLIDNDNVRWRTAGFRYVSPNRIDVTRCGLIIGSFDPVAKQFCLLPSGVVFGAFESSSWRPQDLH
jgi:hypothetical protein